ncbi:MAG: diguanylate cyclase [Bacillota bacterium]
MGFWRHPRKLSSQMVLGLALVSLVPVLLYVVSLLLLVDKTVARIEETDIREHTSGARQFLFHIGEELGSTAQDYGMRDDTYHRLLEGSSEWFHEQAGTWVSKNSGIDLVLVYDHSGNLRFQFPPQVRPGEALSPHFGTGLRSGLVPLGETVFLVGLSPVTRSGGKGPAAGTLVFGRAVDAGLLSRVSSVAGIEVGMFRENSQGVFSPGFVPHAVPAVLDAPVWHNGLLSYSLALEDPSGLPLGHLVGQRPRPVVPVVRRRVWGPFIPVLLAGIALSIVLGRRFARSISRPIMQLEKAFKDLERDEQPQRLSPHGPFEVGSLLDSFNSMAAFLAERTQALKDASMTDELTGLANRRHLFSRLEQEISRAERSGTEMCVLFLDVNGLKMVNDTYGHLVGDRLLQSVGSVLRSNTRDSDIVARFGGDEFVVVLPEASIEEGYVFAQRIKEEMGKASASVAGMVLAMPPLSVGMSVYPGDGASAEVLLRVADRRMYGSRDALG